MNTNFNNIINDQIDCKYLEDELIRFYIYLLKLLGVVERGLDIQIKINYITQERT